MALVFIEKVGTVSDSASGFSIESGNSRRIYYLIGANYLNATDLTDLPTADDVIAQVQEIIGGTNVAVSGDGVMNRTPPLADPMYPWMYASAITNIRGMGSFAFAAANPDLEVPALPNLALYVCYEFTMEFRPRPFPVATDDEIASDIYTLTYYPTNDSGGSPQSISLSIAPEWLRYVDFTLEDTNDYVAAQYLTNNTGCMHFNTLGNVAPGGVGKLAYQFAGSVRQFLPNQIVKLIWYGVPYRYLSSTNSYFARFKGRINQDTFLGYPPGSMLYLGYKPHLYTPPVQAEVLDFIGLSVFSADKLMNIELNFLTTQRTVTLPPAAGFGTNRNYIVGGHNALPWLNTQLFYYAEMGISTDPTRVPAFLSFPASLLFFDPDSPNATIGAGL